MKIKYGKNKNCRNNIHEKPHELVITWCLQKRKKHSQRTVQKEGIFDHMGQVLLCCQAWGRSRGAADPVGKLVRCGGLTHRE